MRLLVVEGNTRAAREEQKRFFGLTPSESYARVLREIEPGADCTILCPADPDAQPPRGTELRAFDGVVLTGSALNIYDGGPAIAAQIELMRAIYAAGVPAFGSCWGLQVATVAAGGEVRPNPLGREVGFARALMPTEAGRAHPLLAGRPAAFTAPAVHLDIIAAPPPDATVLAANAMAGVQAAEIRHDRGTFWGVQYHPEFDLAEIAAILRRMARRLVAEGFCTSPEDASRVAAELESLGADPARTDLAWRHGLDAEVLDPARRRREIRNFLDRRLRPAPT